MIMLKVGYALLGSVLMLMTWAYLAGASPSVPRDGNFPSCTFNKLCTCSKPGPDLGLVYCLAVPLASIPRELNDTNMHILHLRDNNLRHIDDNMFIGTGMHRLEIQRNRISSLSEYAFTGMERTLTELDFQDNYFTSIPQRALQRLQKLKLLNLAGNYINDVFLDNFRGLEDSLQTLVLARNSLTSVQTDAFRSLTALESLDLRANNLLSVSDTAFQSGPPRLNYLNLGDNLLVKIPFQAFSTLRNLKIVDLSRNRITQTFDVFFQGQLSLDTLRLDHNQIDQLPSYAFQNFDVLNRTFLNSNPLYSIAEDAFKDAKIREIYIRDCNVWDLSPRSFRGLESSLHVLDMEGNNLTGIPDQTFEGFDFLKTISFRDNKAAVVPSESFNGFRYTLQRLDLIGDEMGPTPMPDIKHMRNLRWLGLSRLPDTSLQPQHFDGFGVALDELHVRNCKLKEIKNNAFQNIPSLKKLDISENVITLIERDAFADIHTLEELRMANALEMSSVPAQPFKHLTGVEYVDLSNNGLKIVPEMSFRFMKQLKHLNLQDNQIDQIPRGTFMAHFNPNLEELLLSYNNIHIIEAHTFADFSLLDDLFLDDNRIQRLEPGSFMDLKALKHLSLEGNNLRYIPDETFQNLRALETLNIAYNELENFNMDALDQVGTLSSFEVDVSHNKIQALRLNGSSWHSTPNIKKLDFRHNNISFIQRNYFESVEKSLTHLYFSYNQLRNITKEMFGSMKFLEWLDLSHNHLEFLEYDSFRNSKTIQVLYLCHNQLSDLPPDFFKDHDNLRFFDVSFNRLRGFPDQIFHDTKLESLYASHNQLTRIPDSSLAALAPTLRELDLSWNDISSVSSDQLSRTPGIVYLDLSQNRLLRIDDSTFSHLYMLASLHLDHNPIDKLRGRAFVGLDDSLRNLSIANVSLTNFPELPLPRLLALNVSHNIISFLPVTSLTNLTILRQLDLSYNELPNAPNNAWHALPRLRELYIKGNPIRSLSNDSFVHGDRIEVLDISQMPLASFQPGALGPILTLQSLYISTYQEIRNFNLTKLLRHNAGLRHLHILVQQNNFGNELDGLLPPKLANITITGRELRTIQPDMFEGLRSRTLHFQLFNTSVEDLPRSLFKQMGWVRNLTLDVRNNSLRKLGNPNSADYPRAPRSVFLKELRLRNNNWECSCDLGWVEVWSRKWRQFICPTGREAEEVGGAERWPCEGLSRDLREAECRNKNNATLLEIFKVELECGWMARGGAPATTGAPGTIIILTLTASILVKNLFPLQ